jgi:exopolysaccharide biosynthesis polyprenyl glycosylphosphotransferase
MFVLLDAALLAGVGALFALLLGQGWTEFPRGFAGRLATPGFRHAWVFAHATVLPIAFVALGQYRFLAEPSGGWSFPRVVLATTVLDLGLLVFLRLLGWPGVDQLFVLLNFGAGLAAVCAWRALAQRRLRRLTESGKRVRNALFVGTSRLMAEVATMAVREPVLGRRVVGFVGEAAPPPAPPGAWSTADADPVRAAVVENSLRHPRHIWALYRAGDDAERRRILDGLNVEEVYLGPRRDPAEIAAWLRLCQERGVDTHFIPDHHVELGIVPTPWQLGPYVMLDVHRRPFSRLGWWAKRAMDMVVSAVGLVLASPIILLCAVAIKIEHPRNAVFYGGRRVGVKGRHFRQWKFTTMRPDADAMRSQLQSKNARQGPWFQLEAEDDPRITKVGHFLRKYSLNDIPQLWNVLVGDMSMVGPRPLAADEVSRFIEHDVRYYRCFDVKPGITGLWQISDRSNPDFGYRIAKDFEYIDTWSLWKDLLIMAKTPFAMVKGGR